MKILTPKNSAMCSLWVRMSRDKCRAYECPCKGRKAAYVIDIKSEFPGMICKQGAVEMVARGEAAIVTALEGTTLKKIIARNKLSTSETYEAYRAKHPELSLPTHAQVEEAFVFALGDWSNFAIKDGEVFISDEPRNPSVKLARRALMNVFGKTHPGTDLRFKMLDQLREVYGEKLMEEAEKSTFGEIKVEVR